ncbi:MAG: SDR family oxidoreductase [Deltaproteobacteria bacterium]|nr:SDR family oxidoreductase [Deltaproteobacteria bacterium]
MGLFAVSGSASGIGAAVRKHLESGGHSVLGIDLRGAEIEADLSVPTGRAAAVAALERMSTGRLDGLVAAAGVGASHEPIERIVAIDYFGCVALIEGARKLLVSSDGTGGSAVAVSSNTALALPDFGGPLEDVCLSGREKEALADAAKLDGPRCYVSAKRALIRWVRRQAPAWMQEGARLNVIAPGPVRTPLRERDRAHPIIGPNFDAFPQPAGRPAEAREIAEAIGFLLGHPYCAGAVLCVDGGGDAVMRPDVS